MALSLSAEQKSIKDLFISTDRFVIPDYQRPYSWGYSQCLQMFNDIYQAFEKKEDYFLGNLLLARSTDKQDSPLIIDGQQRLITIWLMLKCLSVLLPLYNALPRCLYVNESLRNDSLVIKLLSRIKEINDNKSLKNINSMPISEFNSKHVDNESQTIDGKKIENRFEYNSIFLFSWLDSIQKKDLEDFCDYFLTRVYLLPIEIKGENEEDSTNKTLTIFETLNNRGLELTDSCIFKTRLYGKAEVQKKEQQFMERWMDINHRCEDLKITIDEVFRYYSHILRGRDGITTSELRLRDFFVVGQNAPLKVKNLDEVMNDLEKIVESLEYLQTVRKSNNSATIWLQLLDLYTNNYPNYAVVVYLVINGKENKGDFVNFLQNLVRYCYNYGSSLSIKFGIYIIIKTISQTGSFECAYPDIKEDKFDNIGRLRNGMVLLFFYLQNPDYVLLSYRVSKYYRKSGEFNILPDWGAVDWDWIECSLANCRLSCTYVRRFDMPKPIDELEFLSQENDRKIPNTYNEFIEEDKKIKKTLMNFFEGKMIL